MRYKEGLEDAIEQREESMKLGLAFSGGGFRASFFHIGVLAQMARLGLLRHVEVISTVSGGSIIGALYYLHVKRLLEIKTDTAINNQDYIDIVKEIEVNFLRAVQRNLRMRTFRNPLKNIRMRLATYSRSDRIGELYDEYFYQPVIDLNRTTPIKMRDLKINPMGAKQNFHPLTDNSGRLNKVPILLINATALNTGHNWRFEAVRMGEPPRDSNVERVADKNNRLLRADSYQDITPLQQDIELGLAVAASACVPGIFPPLAISGLYSEEIRVQLVDGGVHDNQGIKGLLDVKCTHFVVSDASGQITDESDPAIRIPAVLSRTNAVLMDRIREEELFRLLINQNVAFMHLRKGLPINKIPWIDSNGRPASGSQENNSAPESPSESFGVAQKVQDLLSQIRTDLDSFTEVESFSLMLDGYKMSEPELRNTIGIKDLISNPITTETPRWNFLQIEPWMIRPTNLYLQQLEIASKSLLKIFRLSWPLTIATVLVVLALSVGLWHFFGSWIQNQLSRSVTIGNLLLAAIILALGFVPWLSRTFKVLSFLRSPTGVVVRFLVEALLPALASVLVAIHLWIFDRLFLRQGTIGRLGTPPTVI